MVRSKVDRRWNLRGQYSSSDWWDPPHGNWPPEAFDAVEQLRSSLAEQPPEDLRCFFVAYPGGKLQRLFQSSVLIATERQGALHDLTEENGLSILGLDRDRGEISFGKPGHEPTHRFSAQALGTMDEATSFWCWAWTAEATGALDPLVLNSARKLHEYGTKHNIPELTYEQIALGVEGDRPWFNAGYLCKIACHLCDAEFVITGGTAEQPNWKEFWLVSAPGVLTPPQSVSRRIFFVIKEALETWGPNLCCSQTRKAIEAFARQRNCTVADWTGQKIEWAPDQRSVECRIRIDDSAGDSICVDFDASGDIAGMGYSPLRGQNAARPSWFKRVFGRG
jgi:hypothetical protein